MGNAPSIKNPTLSGVAPADKTYRTERNIVAKKYSAVRALVIGIGYDKTPYKLAGTRNDAEAMANYLSTRFGEILTLVKLNDGGSEIPPTKLNVEQAMKFICSSASLDNYGNTAKYSTIKDNTLLVIYYSGHGSQVKDLNFDENDGKDETLCLLTDRGGIDNLIDDEINYKYRNMIPVSSDLVVIFDCCHSGSSLDLKYVLKGNTFINAGAKYSETPYPVYYIGGTLDGLCAYEKNGRGYLTQVLISILNKYKNLSLHNISVMLQVELAKLVSPGLQSVTIQSGQLISSQQQFPL